MKHYFVYNNQSPEKLSKAQAKMINFITNPIEAESRAKDLKVIFELATFSSQVPLHRKEKDALYSLNLIRNYLKKIAKD